MSKEAYRLQVEFVEEVAVRSLKRVSLDIEYILTTIGTNNPDIRAVENLHTEVSAAVRKLSAAKTIREGFLKED